MKIYQIQPGDTLTKLGAKFFAPVDAFLFVTPQIKNKDLIRAGDYIYVPEVIYLRGGAQTHD